MKKLVIRGGVFLALLVVLLYVVSLPFRNEDPRIRETYEELYNSAPNTCDAVLVGGSNAYSYFVSPYAYDEYGITVANMGLPALQTSSLRYVMEEARKTQPNALYVITANSFKWSQTEDKVHFATDYMELGKNKFDAINHLSDVAGMKLGRFKFFFPVLLSHANWNKLGSKMYEPEFERVKAGATYNGFLYGHTDVTFGLYKNDDRIVLDPAFEESIDDLFAYIKDNNIRVLFVRLPQAQGADWSVSRLNTVCDKIRDAGFDLLDLEDEADTLGIDFTSDFYNLLHANSHGAVKFTTYFSRYLQETYGFTDKRGQEGFEDWDDAAKRYDGYLRLGVFDFELEHWKKDSSVVMTPLEGEEILPVVDETIEQGTEESSSESVIISADDELASEESQAPQAATATGEYDDTGKAQLNWAPVEGADKLYVYQRREMLPNSENPVFIDNIHEYHWQRVAELPADATSYVAEGLRRNRNYHFAVVPITTDGTTESYGYFDLNGITVAIGK